MTPKEKAKELGNKYLSTGMLIRQSKECALIAVDEILSLFMDNKWDSKYEYYQEVKKEIAKL